MVEGLLVFCFPLCLCWKLFEYRSIVRMMKLSYESEVTETGLRWIMLGVVTFPTSFLILTKHCRCFRAGFITQGAGGATDLLEALRQSTQLEELIFFSVDAAGMHSQIPAGAWHQLHGAWPKLREAPGIPKEELQRLQLGAEGATRRTPSTSTLEIAADNSVALAGPRRLKFVVARDLDSDAMDLMAGLSSSPIEVLDLRFCDRIPAAAWQKVRGAKWLHLRKADFHQCLAERNGWGVLLFSNVFYVYLFVSVGSCSSSDL